jgi:hypothetical protein
MRRRLALLWTPLIIAAALALPSAAAAGGMSSDPYRFRIVSNYCNAHHDVVFKVKFIAAGWSSANELTIDSKSQMDTGYHRRHWSTWETWPRVSSTFEPASGVNHSLILRRVQVNNQHKFVFPIRIVFKLSALQYGLVAWQQTVRSREC